MFRSCVISLAAAVVLGSCGEMSVPVSGQISGGIAAAGAATARLNGKGSFWVQVPGGVKCSGNYNALTTKPSLVVPVGCTDGRSGEAVITRQLNGLSGTAIVTLNDGTTGQFVFGDLKFDQAFGQGGTAKTAGSNPRRRE